MKKENKVLLLCVILSLILLFFATSCGTRKVQKSETKEQEQKTEKSTLEIQTRVDSNTKIIDTSTTDEFEIIPIDNTKEIVVNGKKYFNAKIKHSKKKNNITTNKVEKVSQNAKKEVEIANSKTKVVEVKQTERKSFNFWWLLLLLLIPILYFRKSLFRFLI